MLKQLVVLGVAVITGGLGTAQAQNGAEVVRPDSLLRMAANADGIAAIVKRIGTAADIVVKNAQKPRPTITEVASSASNLALIVASLDTAIKRDPSEAREHVDVLKRIAEDEYNLGLAILGAVGMDDSNDGAAVLIEQIGALAESIYDSAREY